MSKENEVDGRNILLAILERRHLKGRD